MEGCDDYVRDSRVVMQQWEHRNVVTIVGTDGLVIADDTGPA